MLYNLKNIVERNRFKDYVNKLYMKQAVVEVKEQKPQRTLKQNAYLHVLLGYFACEYGCDMQYCKFMFFKLMVNPEIFKREITNKKGQTVIHVRSSRDLSIDEMRLAITRFRNWSAMPIEQGGAGIELPDATISEDGDVIMTQEQQEQFIFCRQEMERNQEFL